MLWIWNLAQLMAELMMNMVELDLWPSGIDALQALIEFVLKISIYCIKMNCITLLLIAGLKQTFSDISHLLNLQ